VKAALDALDSLDITPLDSPEPELSYLFKHIVTHEVTYESLPFATRAKLHEQLARYLENKAEAIPSGASPLLDTITFHYGRSDNTVKKREYYQKAAEGAFSVSAFMTAVEYSTRLLELVPTSDPARAALALGLADAHHNLGDYPAARAAIAQAQAAAQTDADRATALALLGETASVMGDYAAAGTILTQAVSLARASSDRLALCRAIRALGYVYWQMGKLDDARAAQEESLALARDLGDVTGELVALNVLGLLQTDLSEAERLFTEVHTRAVAVGNREREMTALNNLGNVAVVRKDHMRERDFFQQALALAREIGAQDMIALVLSNLAEGDIQLGNLSAARAGLHEALALALRLGSMPEVAGAVGTFAKLAHAEGQTLRALALMGLARNQPAWSTEHQRDLDRVLAEWGLDPSVVEVGLARGAELDWDATIQELLAESG
jgi:tetratricopeptide (TPR) repeat protein